jgi:predicted phosphodiesterase
MTPGRRWAFRSFLFYAVMKIVIISDIHGNFDALSALPEIYDELWVLGDLVNYGPEPAAVIDVVRSKAALIVCGNHDYSIGFNQDPHCSPRFTEMAEATRQYTNAVLSVEHKHFLRHLPRFVETQRDRTRFYLCHAIPSDPLFGYCLADSPRWLSEVEAIDADIVLVGHTHMPFVQSVGARQVVNPGSLGQPKTGSPGARYAVWEDGRIELKSYSYPVERTVAKVQALPIQHVLRDELSAILRTGKGPPAPEMP